MKKPTLYILFLFCITQFYFAQTMSDSLTLFSPITNNSISSSFDKLLNTSNYNGKLFYGININKLYFVIEENFNSTVIQSSTNSIKDDQFLSLSGIYSLTPMLSVGTALKNRIYSGDKRLAINKAAYLNSLLFIKYFPISRIMISPFGGISSNEQVGNKDNGFIYGIEGKVNRLKLNDFYVNSSAKFQNEDISPRKNMIRFFNLKLNSKLQDIYNNRLEFQYSQLKKDFYLETDSLITSEFNINNNIQSRNETRYVVEDRLSIPRSSSNFTFNLNGVVSKRIINRNIKYKLLSNITTSSFDTQVEELRLGLRSQVNYYSNFINSDFKIGFSQREENHIAKPLKGANQIIFEKKKTIEEQKSNRMQIVVLSSSGTIVVSSNDNILLSLFTRKIKYDTPSEENFDDRDELLSIASVQFNHTFNPLFNIFLNINASNNHIAYIFAERSANNNKNRSIKFSGGSSYRGKKVVSNNVAEVSANYTTYDFEKDIPTQKSFAFRQVAFKDSSVIKIQQNLLFKMYGYVKLSEQGNFNCENFSGKPLRFLQEIFLEPKFSIPVREFFFGLGLRFFSLSTFVYTQQNERVLQSKYASIGPLAELKYLLAQRLNINMRGYYEFITLENNVLIQRANLYLAVNWNF